MDKVKFFIQQSWLLIAASLSFGVLLAVTNAALTPRIEQNKKDKINDRMKQLVPQAEGFDVYRTVELSEGRAYPEKVSIYKGLTAGGETAGYAFIARGSGFADKIELIIAVDEDFDSLSGYKVLASNETPGFGDKIKNDYLQGQFKGAPAGELLLKKTGAASAIDEEIVAITGATVSSQAVVDIFNNYVLQIKDQLNSKGSE